MLDTLALIMGYKGKTPKKIESDFNFLGDRYVFNPPSKNGHALYSLTWSIAPDGIGYLTATGSLPKSLYGNNVELISDEADIFLALDSISAFASEATGLEFDARQANVCRLDVCHNWQIGEEDVYAYLRALRNATYPRMKRNIYEVGTVNFTNWAGTRNSKRMTQRVTVYSKHSDILDLAHEGKATEAELHASVGVLRLEHRFSKSTSCKRLAARLGLLDRRAHSMLREHVFDRVLGETMKELGLDKPIESGDSRLALVREYYGIHSPQYKRLALFIILGDEHGFENLVPLKILSRSRFYEHKRELEKAGAWLVSPLRRTLPPLRLVRETRGARRASVYG